MKRIAYFCMLGSFLIAPEIYAKEDPKVDSLLHQVSVLQSDVELAKTYYQLAVYYYGDYPQTLPYISHALEFAEASRNDEILSKSAYVYGLVQEKLANTKEAFIGFHKGLTAYKALGINQYTAECYMGIGRLYLHAHQPEKASVYFEEAKAYMAGESAEARSSLYVDLGDLYFEDGDYDAAATYYALSIELTEDVRNIAYAENWMGNSYLEGGKYEEALAAYDRSLSFAKEAGVFEMYSAFIEHNRAHIKQQQGDYEGALKGFEVAQSFNEYSSISMQQLTLNSMAETHISLGNLEKAASLLDQSIDLGVGEFDWSEEYLASFELAIEVAHDLGRIDQAFAYQTAYQGQLVNVNEALAEVKDAQAELEVQLAENEILAAELAHANKVRFIAVSVATGLGIVVLILLLARMYTRHQRLRGKFSRKQAAIRELKRMAVTEEW